MRKCTYPECERKAWRGRTTCATHYTGGRALQPAETCTDSARNGRPYTNAELARITKLPDLDTIVDPERLERLIAITARWDRHFLPSAPLRLKVATQEYHERAIYRLEHPEEL